MNLQDLASRDDFERKSWERLIYLCRMNLSKAALPVLCLVLGLSGWLVGLSVDFEVYHRAVNDFFSGGWEQVYRPKELTPFKYHPFTVWLFAPLGLLPFGVAKAVWGLANAFFTWDSLRRLQRFWNCPDWMPLVALLCVVHAWSWQIKFGNVTCLMLWLFTLAFFEKNRIVSALAPAILILLKPIWLALLPVYVLSRDWETLHRVIFFTAMGCLVVFLPGIESGFTSYDLWAQTLSDPVSDHNYNKNDNQSFYGILFRYREWLDGYLFPVWMAGCGIVFAAAWSGFRKRPPGWELALLSLPPLLFAGPLTWIHHQILLIPVMLWLLTRQKYQTVALATLLLTCTGQLLVGRDLFVLIHQEGLPVMGYLALIVLPEVQNLPHFQVIIEKLRKFFQR